MSDYPTAPEGTAFAAFFASLEDLGIGYAGATGRGGQFHCPNPNHDDENASFDVAWGRKGKPVFACAPCDQSLGHTEFARVLRDEGVRLGGDPVRPEEVNWGDIPAPSYSRSAGGSFVQGQPSVVYTYNFPPEEPGGKPVPNFKVYRFDSEQEGKKRKSFQPRRYVMGSGFVTGLEGTERTPYKLERFERWLKTFTRIYLVEGEKAADALYEQRKPVTTFHGGTNTTPAPDWVTRYGFDRFEEVRVWPDADEAGVLWARARVEELLAAGVRASIWGVSAEDVEPKDDAFDVFDRGQKPTRLNEAQVDALALLKPLPVKAENPAPEPLSIVVGGMTIASVPPASQGAVSAPPAKVREAGTRGGKTQDDPYNVVAGVEPHTFAKELVDRYFRLDGTLTLRHHDEDHSVWLWLAEENRYEWLSPDRLKKVMTETLDGSWEVTKDGEVRPLALKERVRKEVEGFVTSICLTTPRGPDRLLPSTGGIPFQNGWLNIETGELLPSGPERDIRWTVPAEYEDDADCPEWFAFLDSLGFEEGTDERRLLRQWFGYLLSGSTAQQKALLLLGPKRAGKGTILAVAERLLGQGATGTQLAHFASNFGLQNLIGKGLATIGDARFERKTDKALYSTLLSWIAGDTMTVDVKYATPASIVPTARLMIATNESPKFTEASDALASRFVIIEFERTFYGREDLDLKPRVLSELPGIARWALDGYRELEGLGSFTETKKGKALQEQIIRDGAPIREFVEEECEIGPYSVPNQTLFNEWEVWAVRHNLFVGSQQGFMHSLKTAFPGQFEDHRPRVSGAATRSVKGLRMR